MSFIALQTSTVTTLTSPACHPSPLHSPNPPLALTSAPPRLHNLPNRSGPALPSSHWITLPGKVTAPPPTQASNHRSSQAVRASNCLQSFPSRTRSVGNIVVLPCQLFPQSLALAVGSPLWLQLPEDWHPSLTHHLLCHVISSLSLPLIRTTNHPLGRGSRLTLSLVYLSQTRPHFLARLLYLVQAQPLHRPHLHRSLPQVSVLRSQRITLC